MIGNATYSPSEAGNMLTRHGTSVEVRKTLSHSLKTFVSCLFNLR